MCKYRVISGAYFSVFSPNTGKYGPEITPYLDTFQAMSDLSVVCSFTGLGFSFFILFVFGNLPWKLVSNYHIYTAWQVSKKRIFFWSVFSRIRTEYGIKISLSLPLLSCISKCHVKNKFQIEIKINISLVWFWEY